MIEDPEDYPSTMPWITVALVILGLFYMAQIKKNTEDLLKKFPQ